MCRVPQREKLGSITMKHQLLKPHKKFLLPALATLVLLVTLTVTAVTAQAQVTQTTSFSQLYQNIKDSVVVITDLQPQTTILGTAYALIQGSGFVYNLNGQMIILTNYHVIAQAINISVTFNNGNGYAANVLGADPYSDLAVLSTNAPANEYKPLNITSSSTLQVGDFVAALGSPFGLSGSLTTGVVSQVGRTITEETTGNYPIANVIQTDASINPGNSGGPLVNSAGEVVGINTAGVTGSQGVGFAIPSDMILREINTLVSTGTYTQHPYLGITSVDMNYDIASQTGVNVTYGVLIQQVVDDGAADNAGIRGGTVQRTIDGATLFVGGDVITALNGTRIIAMDQLSSYLEQNTLPNQTITATIIRDNTALNLTVTLGTRPMPTGFIPPSPQPTTLPLQSTNSPAGSTAIPEFSPTITVATVAMIACACLALAAKKRQSPI
jgi:S1-C subfamily serine protease